MFTHWRQWGREAEALVAGGQPVLTCHNFLPFGDSAPLSAAPRSRSHWMCHGHFGCTLQWTINAWFLPSPPSRQLLFVSWSRLENLKKRDPFLPSGFPWWLRWWRVETQVWSLGRKDPLGKGMATHSTILAWGIPWTRLQFIGSQRVGHDWATNTLTFFISFPAGPSRSSVPLGCALGQVVAPSS